MDKEQIEKLENKIGELEISVEDIQASIGYIEHVAEEKGVNLEVQINELRQKVKEREYDIADLKARL